MSYEYEELIEMKKNNEITWVEFINLQDDLKEDYEMWRKSKKREEDEQSAQDFLDYWDDYVMDHQADEII